MYNDIMAEMINKDYGITTVHTFPGFVKTNWVSPDTPFSDEFAPYPFLC